MPTASNGGSTSDAPATTTSGGTVLTTTSGAATGGSITGVVGDSSGTTAPGPDFGVGQSCDIISQDCPRGYKCIVYSEDGPGTPGSSSGCFPVVDDPVEIGETCTAIEGVGSGLDDCPVGAVCWNVDSDTNEGYCLAYCTGKQTNPTCDDPEMFCSIPGAASFGMWCFFACDPRQDECEPGQTCVPGNPYSFRCGIDTSGKMGAAGDPCEFVNACNPGLTCLDAEQVPDCTESSGCCSSYCTIGDDSPCLPGQTCEPFYEDDVAPHPAWDGLGLCALGPV